MKYKYLKIARLKFISVIFIKFKIGNINNEVFRIFILKCESFPIENMKCGSFINESMKCNSFIYERRKYKKLENCNFEIRNYDIHKI